METVMQIAIETYSDITGRTFENIVDECQKGNKTIIESIQMLMFATL